MEKYSQALRDKHWSTKKGQLYVFLVAGNDLAYANLYSRFSLDKSQEILSAYINNRLEVIFGKQGVYWKEEYKGYQELLTKGRAAQNDIEKGYYTLAVIEFIETAVKSYLPKGEKKEEIKTTIPEIGKVIIAGEGISAKQLAKSLSIEKEDKINIIKEEENFSKLNSSTL